MVFMMVNNFRMQATMITLAGLPACLSRWANAFNRRIAANGGEGAPV
jgi:hypothetical protein